MIGVNETAGRYAESTNKPRSIGESRIVASLSAEFGVPVDEITKIYELEQATLAARSRVPNFVAIFVLRNVRDMLGQRLEEERPRPIRLASPLFA